MHTEIVGELLFFSPLASAPLSGRFTKKIASFSEFILQPRIWKIAGGIDAF